jgi:hypothetical protein
MLHGLGGPLLGFADTNVGVQLRNLGKIPIDDLAGLVGQRRRPIAEDGCYLTCRQPEFCSATAANNMTVPIAESWINYIFLVVPSLL